MRRGRACWTTRCPGPLLERVKDLLGGGTSATETFRRLDLGRQVSRSTFRHWAASWRRENAERREPAGGDPGAVGGRRGGGQPALLELCLGAIEEAVIGGRVKLYELTAAVKALVALDQLRIAEEANVRARERHERDLKDFRAAVERATKGGQKALSREEVYGLVDQVMRGEAA